MEEAIKKLDRSLVLQVAKNRISVSFAEYKLLDLQDKVIDQSLEIVRMRIDSEGTKEPIIQRQGNQSIHIAPSAGEQIMTGFLHDISL